MNGLQRGLAVVLVVGGGAAAGFISYRLMPGREDRPAPLAISAGEQGPDSRGAPDEARPATPVPDTLPDLTLPDLAGTDRPLRSFGGRPLIVNFWATWCAPCRHEIPLLQRLRQQYRGDRLEVVGIAVDFAAAVRDYLKQTPIDYPLLIGENGGLEAAERFGMGTALPFSVFLDTRSRIVALKVGELHPEEAEFILGQVHALDSGQATLPDARERIEKALQELATKRALAQQKRD